MAELEQTARRGYRVEPQEQIDWLEPTLDPDLGYRRWLPTQGFPYPGEPDRRCDTVAELISRSGRQRPWALVLEVEANPRRARPDRAQEYEIRIARDLRHGPHRRDRYDVASIVLILRGRRKSWAVRRRLPGTRLQTHWRGGLVCLADRDARLTLEQITVGNVGRSILIWIPLLRGGDQPEVVQRWAELARAEPDAQKRSEYGILAKVFAERAGCAAVWQPVLEGWEMWKSQVIAEYRDQGHKEGHKEGLKEGRNEGRNEGKVLGQQELIVRLLQRRFATGVAPELEAIIRAQADTNVLVQWFDQALTAPTLDAVRAVIH